MRHIATLVACIVLLGGCATITRGTTQAWSVQTDPVGADVRLSSGEQCKTPCTLQKKRKDPFQVTITKDGYETVVTQIITTVKGAGAAGMAGNVIIGGIIGVGVDAASGATKDLIPNPLIVKLALTGSGQTAVINTPPPPTNDSVQDDGRMARLSHMGDAARKELAGLQCAKDFKEITADGEIEVYQGTCNDGRVQRVSCDEFACRQSK
ncbi:MAG: PEGA domain-containing protein [Proteobacteria bacterium]|nr:PEGA domain-containing protein [Pseudomonadota bacterium]